jgi:hypothetical protein
MAANTQKPNTAPDAAPQKRGPGRPRKNHYATARELIAAVVTPDEFEAMIRVMVDAAKSGDYKAFLAIMDRFYGKPVEQIKQTTETRVKVEFTEPPVIEADTEDPDSPDED